MKKLEITLTLIMFASGLAVRAAGIPNISTGALGPFAPTASIAVPLPPDGRLNYTWVNIPQSVTVTFIRNAANTPVYLLASEGITNGGTINISGEAGTTLRGGFPGPGGFAGGEPGLAGGAPGDGLGPGSGGGGTTPGNAAYGTAPTSPANPLHGRVYGSPLLIPLVGGSGGGGSPGQGGHGGGGAILMASSTHIAHVGTIRAWSGGGNGAGSGGAVRLLAPAISGTGNIDVSGWNSGASEGHGRVSCEMLDRSQFALRFTPAGNHINTTNYIPIIAPPHLPTLRVVSVGGMTIPSDAPAGFAVTLPLNAPANQPIVLEASGFDAEVPVAIRVTPVSGPALPPTIQGVIDNASADPATITLNATLPANTPLTVNAWTR